MTCPARASAPRSRAGGWPRRRSRRSSATGVPLDGYARQIVERYGPGELGWLRRRSSLPEAVARLGVRIVLGSARARRRIVFNSIFGMREVAP